MGYLGRRQSDYLDAKFEANQAHSRDPQGSRPERQADPVLGYRSARVRGTRLRRRRHEILGCPGKVKDRPDPPRHSSADQRAFARRRARGSEAQARRDLSWRRSEGLGTTRAQRPHALGRARRLSRRQLELEPEVDRPLSEYRGAPPDAMAKSTAAGGLGGDGRGTI